uniref:Uncharacterized protein n=1 Tax=Knipowitschia caucasica TaxID=637954 RepID=A0AAV2MDL5_KNICA
MTSTFPSSPNTQIAEYRAVMHTARTNLRASLVPAAAPEDPFSPGAEPFVTPGENGIRRLVLSQTAAVSGAKVTASMVRRARIESAWKMGNVWSACERSEERSLSPKAALLHSSQQKSKPAIKLTT